MKLTELATVIGAELIIRYNHFGQTPIWQCDFKNVEVKEGAILSGPWGGGDTPEQAIFQFIENIRGKLLVYNATGSDRREYRVPVTLSAI